jgi:predicted transcriptional regulator
MFELEDIRMLRKRFGLTQAELAKQSGVSQSLIAKVESGRIEPTYTKVKKIFEVLSSINLDTGLKAGDLMVTRIIKCSPQDSVHSVIGKMREYKISQLPVFEAKSVVGVVSESTILDKLSGAGDDLRKLTVRNVMDECPPIVHIDTPSAVIRHLLRHFPTVIVAKKGIVVGLITKSDLLGVAA